MSHEIFSFLLDCGNTIFDSAKQNVIHLCITNSEEEIMPVSVRLDKETEELLEKASRLLRKPKSEVIKRSIKEYCKPMVEEKKQNLSDFIKKLIKDHPGSGRGDLSIRAEEILRERWGRKR
jgi:predicted DNA-binding protein